jgi:hypothetical protein
VSSEEENNKALVRRFVEAQWEKDLAALEQMMAPDFVDRSVLPGQGTTREDYLQDVAEDQAASPDARLRGCADRSWSAGRSAFPSVVHPAFSNQPPHDDHHLRERHPEIDHPPYPLRTPQQFLVRLMPRVRPLRHPTLPGP